MVRGIDNIGTCTTDLPKSVAFYETLGIRGARAWWASRTRTATTFTCCGGSKRDRAAALSATTILSSSDLETGDGARY